MQYLLYHAQVLNQFTPREYPNAAPAFSLPKKPANLTEPTHPVTSLSFISGKGVVGGWVGGDITA